MAPVNHIHIRPKTSRSLVVLVQLNNTSPFSEHRAVPASSSSGNQTLRIENSLTSIYAQRFEPIHQSTSRRLEPSDWGKRGMGKILSSRFVLPHMTRPTVSTNVPFPKFYPNFLFIYYFSLLPKINWSSFNHESFTILSTVRNFHIPLLLHLRGRRSHDILIHQL